MTSMIPQLVRVLRTRVTDGLSAGTITLTLISATLWGSYGFGIADPTQIVPNVVCVGIFAWLAHIVAVETGVLHPWHGPAVVVGTAVVAGCLAVLAGPMATAAVGTVLGFFIRVPQVRVALSGQPLGGLDPWALLMGMASILMWLTYGMAAGDVAVVVSSAVGGAMHIVVVYRRLPPRRTLSTLAAGRLGPTVARTVTPIARRFPHQVPLLDPTFAAAA